MTSSASTGAGGAPGANGARAFVIDPGASRLTLRAFAGGMLSAVGHNPTFAVRRFEGAVRFNPEKPAGSLTLRMAADSLAVQGEMSDKDRREIERMTKDEVLEASKHPDIVYACPETSVRKIGEGQFEVTLPGSLSLHGVTLRQLVSARISLMGTMLRAFGEFSLQQPDYDIKPVTVGGGMLRVKDELRGTFDIVARADSGA
ncbi:MAG TPA: YceI family protein [Gemmatimonadales bacterium]|nr:YceI family protein [Gemmatimonadales bacterium]